MPMRYEPNPDPFGGPVDGMGGFDLDDDFSREFGMEDPLETMGDTQDDNIGELLRQLFDILVDRGMVRPDALMLGGTGEEYDPLVGRMADMSMGGLDDGLGMDLPPMIGGAPPMPGQEPYPDEDMFTTEDERSFRRRRV